MLGSKNVIAFLGTTNRERAKAFFGDTLGLCLTHEDNFAIVYDANGTMLRVTPVQSIAPAQYTVLGWEVENIVETVAELQRAGVRFEVFGFPGQDANGIWTAPGGDKVAWFKDPDGQTLSVSQHVRSAE